MLSWYFFTATFNMVDYNSKVAILSALHGVLAGWCFAKVYHGIRKITLHLR